MKILKTIGIVIVALIPNIAFTAEVPLTAIPTEWRLQGNVGGGVATYFTGSSCANGQLTFGTNATAEDQNRYWSMIMAAKISNKTVLVFYDDTTANCQIQHFILKEE